MCWRRKGRSSMCAGSSPRAPSRSNCLTRSYHARTARGPLSSIELPLLVGGPGWG